MNDKTILVAGLALVAFLMFRPRQATAAAATKPTTTTGSDTAQWAASAAAITTGLAGLIQAFKD